jgi:hypothetical protein
VVSAHFVAAQGFWPVVAEMFIGTKITRRRFSRGARGEGAIPRVYSTGLLYRVRIFIWAGFLSKHRDDIFDGNDVELVVWFEIDWDSAFRVEDNFVVLSKGHIIVVFDLATDRDDTAGDGRNFGRIREGDSTFGFPFGFVFEHQNASSDRLDSFKRRFFRHGTLGSVRGLGNPTAAGASKRSRGATPDGAIGVKKTIAATF